MALSLKDLLRDFVESDAMKCDKDAGFCMAHLYYVLFLAAWIACCLPATAVEMLPGFLFGHWKGFLCSVAGKNLGSWVSIWLGKTFFKDYVVQQLPRYPMMRTLDRMIKKGGLRAVFMVRVLYLPMMLKNYGLAALGVPFWQLAIAAALTGLPFAAAWTYMGSTAKDALDIINGHTEKAKPSLPFEAQVLLGAAFVTAALLLSKQARGLYAEIGQVYAQMKEESAELREKAGTGSKSKVSNWAPRNGQTVAVRPAKQRVR